MRILFISIRECLKASFVTTMIDVSFISAACETPASPTNGAVTLSADGTTATYTCIANYTLDGDVTRTCLTDTNTWTGTDPTCSKKLLRFTVVNSRKNGKTISKIRW